MSGWMWIALFVVLLLGVGLWTDRRRRHSTGGEARGNDPTRARYGAQGDEARHVGPFGG